MPYRVPTSLELSAGERAELESWARRRKTAQGLALRARIVLLAADGLSNTVIAAQLATGKHTVGKWRERFAHQRADGLLDEPRPGAPRRIGDEQVAELIDRRLSERPQGATHWSRRSMAKASGISGTTVGRVWHAFGLQPHRSEIFKLSADPLFAEKVRDIVGLYLSPPTRHPGAVRRREIPGSGARRHAAATPAAARTGEAAHPRPMPSTAPPACLPPST